MTGIFSAASSYSSSIEFAAYGQVSTINAASSSQPYFLGAVHGDRFSGLHNIGDKVFAHINNANTVEFAPGGSSKKNVSVYTGTETIPVSGYLAVSCHPTLNKLYLGSGTNIYVADTNNTVSSTVNTVVYSATLKTYTSLGIGGTITSTTNTDEIAVSYDGTKLFIRDTAYVVSIPLDGSGIPLASGISYLVRSGSESFRTLIPLPNGNLAIISQDTSPAALKLRTYSSTLQLVQDYGTITTSSYNSSICGIATANTEIYIAATKVVLRYTLGNQLAVEIAGRTSSSDYADGFGANAGILNIRSIYYYDGVIYFWDNGRFRTLT